MEFLLSPQAWLSAGIIFGLRVTDMTLDTLRVLFVMRGRKLNAWILGFFQALVFVIAISTVLRDLSNPLNILVPVGIAVEVGHATDTPSVDN